MKKNRLVKVAIFKLPIMNVLSIYFLKLNL
jgi:hypothetical protein